MISPNRSRPRPARHDIAPDPTDDLVDIFDIARMTAFLRDELHAVGGR